VLRADQTKPNDRVGCLANSLVIVGLVCMPGKAQNGKARNSIKPCARGAEHATHAAHRALNTKSKLLDDAESICSDVHACKTAQKSARVQYTAVQLFLRHIVNYIQLATSGKGIQQRVTLAEE